MGLCGEGNMSTTLEMIGTFIHDVLWKKDLSCFERIYLGYRYGGWGKVEWGHSYDGCSDYKKYSLLLIGGRLQSWKFICKEDVVVSDGICISLFKAPTYIQECELSIADQPTAINWVNTLIFFSHSLACYNLIQDISEFCSCPPQTIEFFHLRPHCPLLKHLTQRITKNELWISWLLCNWQLEHQRWIINWDYIVSRKLSRYSVEYV